MASSRYQPIHNTEISPKTGKYIAKKRVYTVWLVATQEDKWNIYRCPDCTLPIVQYKGDLIAEVPGEAPGAYPMKVQCRNRNCGRKILFKDAIEQVI